MAEFTALLGLVHGRIRLLDQVFGLDAIARERRDPQAGRGHEGAVTQHHGDPDRLQDLLGHLGRVELARELGQQHRELVSPETRGRVGLPQTSHQPLRDAAQEAIPHGVAQAVVDHLEAIEVQEHHGQGLTAAPGRGHGLEQAVVEEQPVRQAGELIAGGQVPCPLPGGVQLPDRALARERDPDRGGQQAWARLVLGEEAPRAAAQGPVSQRFVVDLREDHDGYLGRPQPRVQQGRERLRAAGLQRQQEHVELLGSEQLQGRGEPGRMLHLVGRAARRVEGASHPREVGGVPSHQEHAGGGRPVSRLGGSLRAG